MKSLRVFDSQARYGVLAIALVLAAVVPAFASAAQLTERSAALSSSSKGASGVSYQFTFNADNTDAAALVVEFCSDTPLIGEACTAPTGMDVSTSGTVSDGGTLYGTWTANKAIVAKAVTSGENTFTISGVKNPTNAGTLYARVVSYDTTANAANYASASLGTGVVDEGSVALSITDTVGVSGAVLETMTFCVSGESGGTSPITANCTGTLVDPVLRLGKDTGGVIALDSTDIYTGDIYTQISTNAASGAVISLKSNAVGCGGLLRSSDTGACDIAPALAAGITAGQAKFGVMTGAADTGGPDGDIQPVGNYNASTYALNWASGEATGVTSPYGDPILNTNSKPANNKSMKLTFGASVANNTPAGNYSADLSLIATGKF